MATKKRRRPQASVQPRESHEAFERRLRRERVVGLGGLAVAALILVLNWIMEFAPELRLLPGGHSELYFLLGVVGATAAAWLAFDLGMTRQRRR